MNWLEYLGQQLDSQSEVRVYTMEASADYHKYEPAVQFIKVIRLGNSNGKKGIFRYANYLFFYSSVIVKLSGWRPKMVMYYETLSALPAIFYKRLIKKDSRLFIHYHEYTSLQEYRTGMVLNRWEHVIEKKTYHLADLISHTNPDRIRLFKQDNEDVALPKTYVLPNYPPRNWGNISSQNVTTPVVKFVYIGSLSFETMYLREFSEWIIKQNGRATWDIYSGNIAQDAKKYLQSVPAHLVQFHDGKDYFLLPQILQKYTVGVILYKGHIPNFIYNAPNKLFEYWACGLDVWFPEKMTSSLPYATKGYYPRIIPVDFEKLESCNLTNMIAHQGLAYKPSDYFCEQEFEGFLRRCIAG